MQQQHQSSPASRPATTSSLLSSSSPRPTNNNNNNKPTTYNLSLEDRKRLIRQTAERMPPGYLIGLNENTSKNISNDNNQQKQKGSLNALVESSSPKSRPGTATRRKYIVDHPFHKNENTQLSPSLRKIDFGLPEDDSKVNYVFSKRRLVSRIKDPELGAWSSHHQQSKYHWRSPMRQQQRGGGNNHGNNNNSGVIHHNDGTISITRSEVHTEVRSAARPISRGKNLSTLVDDFETAQAIFADDDDGEGTKQRKDDDEEEKKGEYLKYTLCIPRRGGGDDRAEQEQKKEIEKEKGTIRDNHELTGLHEGDKKEVLENIIEKKEEEKKNDAEEDIKEKPLDLSDDDVGTSPPSTTVCHIKLVDSDGTPIDSQSSPSSITFNLLPRSSSHSSSSSSPTVSSPLFQLKSAILINNNNVVNDNNNNNLDLLSLLSSPLISFHIFLVDSLLELKTDEMLRKVVENLTVVEFVDDPSSMTPITKRSCELLIHIKKLSEHFCRRVIISCGGLIKSAILDFSTIKKEFFDRVDSNRHKNNHNSHHSDYYSSFSSIQPVLNWVKSHFLYDDVSMSFSVQDTCLFVPSSVSTSSSSSSFSSSSSLSLYHVKTLNDFARFLIHHQDERRHQKTDANDDDDNDDLGDKISASSLSFSPPLVFLLEKELSTTVTDRITKTIFDSFVAKVHQEEETTDIEVNNNNNRISSLITKMNHEFDEILHSTSSPSRRSIVNKNNNNKTVSTITTTNSSVKSITGFEDHIERFLFQDADNSSHYNHHNKHHHDNYSDDTTSSVDIVSPAKQALAWCLAMILNYSPITSEPSLNTKPIIDKIRLTRMHPWKWLVETMSRKSKSNSGNNNNNNSSSSYSFAIDFLTVLKSTQIAFGLITNTIMMMSSVGSHDQNTTTTNNLLFNVAQVLFSPASPLGDPRQLFVVSSLMSSLCSWCQHVIRLTVLAAAAAASSPSSSASSSGSYSSVDLTPIISQTRQLIHSYDRRMWSVAVAMPNSNNNSINSRPSSSRPVTPSKQQERRRRNRITMMTMNSNATATMPMATHEEYHRLRQRQQLLDEAVVHNDDNNMQKRNHEFDNEDEEENSNMENCNQRTMIKIPKPPRSSSSTTTTALYSIEAEDHQHQHQPMTATTKTTTSSTTTISSLRSKFTLGLPSDEELLSSIARGVAGTRRRKHNDDDNDDEDDEGNIVVTPTTSARKEKEEITTTRSPPYSSVSKKSPSSPTAAVSSSYSRLNKSLREMITEFNDAVERSGISINKSKNKKNGESPETNRRIVTSESPSFSDLEQEQSTNQKHQQQLSPRQAVLKAILSNLEDDEENERMQIEQEYDSKLNSIQHRKQKEYLKTSVALNYRRHRDYDDEDGPKSKDQKEIEFLMKQRFIALQLVEVNQIIKNNNDFDDDDEDDENNDMELLLHARTIKDRNNNSVTISAVEHCTIDIFRKRSDGGRIDDEEEENVEKLTTLRYDAVTDESTSSFSTTPASSGAAVAVSNSGAGISAECSGASVVSSSSGGGGGAAFHQQNQKQNQLLVSPSSIFLTTISTSSLKDNNNNSEIILKLNHSEQTQKPLKLLKPAHVNISNLSLGGEVQVTFTYQDDDDDEEDETAIFFVASFVVEELSARRFSPPRFFGGGSASSGSLSASVSFTNNSTSQQQHQQHHRQQKHHQQQHSSTSSSLTATPPFAATTTFSASLTATGGGGYSSASASGGGGGHYLTALRVVSLMLLSSSSEQSTIPFTSIKIKNPITSELLGEIVPSCLNANDENCHYHFTFLNAADYLTGLEFEVEVESGKGLNGDDGDFNVVDDVGIGYLDWKDLRSKQTIANVKISFPSSSVGGEVTVLSLKLHLFGLTVIETIPQQWTVLSLRSGVDLLEEEEDNDDNDDDQLEDKHHKNNNKRNQVMNDVLSRLSVDVFLDNKKIDRSNNTLLDNDDDDDDDINSNNNNKLFTFDIPSRLYRLHGLSSDVVHNTFALPRFDHQYDNTSDVNNSKNNKNKNKNARHRHISSRKQHQLASMMMTRLEFDVHRQIHHHQYHSEQIQQQQLLQGKIDINNARPVARTITVPMSLYKDLEMIDMNIVNQISGTTSNNNTNTNTNTNKITVEESPLLQITAPSPPKHCSGTTKTKTTTTTTGADVRQHKNRNHKEGEEEEDESLLLQGASIREDEDNSTDNNNNSHHQKVPQSSSSLAVNTKTRQRRSASVMLAQNDLFRFQNTQSSMKKFQQQQQQQQNIAKKTSSSSRLSSMVIIPHPPSALSSKNHHDKDKEGNLPSSLLRLTVETAFTSPALCIDAAAAAAEEQQQKTSSQTSSYRRSSTIRILSPSSPSPSPAASRFNKQQKPQEEDYTLLVFQSWRSELYPKVKIRIRNGYHRLLSNHDIGLSSTTTTVASDTTNRNTNSKSRLGGRQASSSSISNLTNNTGRKSSLHLFSSHHNQSRPVSSLSNTITQLPLISTSSVVNNNNTNNNYNQKTTLISPSFIVPADVLHDDWLALDVIWDDDDDDDDFENSDHNDHNRKKKNNEFIGRIAVPLPKNNKNKNKKRNDNNDDDERTNTSSSFSSTGGVNTMTLEVMTRHGPLPDGTSLVLSIAQLFVPPHLKEKEQKRVAEVGVQTKKEAISKYETHLFRFLKWKEENLSSHHHNINNDIDYCILSDALYESKMWIASSTSSSSSSSSSFVPIVDEHFPANFEYSYYSADSNRSLIDNKNHSSKKNIFWAKPRHFLSNGELQRAELFPTMVLIDSSSSTKTHNHHSIITIRSLSLSLIERKQEQETTAVPLLDDRPFLSALSLLQEEPILVRRTFIKNAQDLWSSPLNGFGCFVRSHNISSNHNHSSQNQETTILPIITDDWLPATTSPSVGGLILPLRAFGGSLEYPVLWPSALQKCVAKFYGSYEDCLSELSLVDSMQLISGLPHFGGHIRFDKVHAHDDDKNNLTNTVSHSYDLEEVLLNRMKPFVCSSNMSKKNTSSTSMNALCCLSTSSSSSTFTSFLRNRGLEPNQSYPVLDIVVLNNNNNNENDNEEDDHGNDNSILMILCRDTVRPISHWTGKYRRGSPHWKKMMMKISSHTDPAKEEEENTFWLTCGEAREVFDNFSMFFYPSSSVATTVGGGDVHEDFHEIRISGGKIEENTNSSNFSLQLVNTSKTDDATLLLSIEPDVDAFLLQQQQKQFVSSSPEISIKVAKKRHRNADDDEDDEQPSTFFASPRGFDQIETKETDSWIPLFHFEHNPEEDDNDTNDDRIPHQRLSSIGVCISSGVKEEVVNVTMKMRMTTSGGGHDSINIPFTMNLLCSPSLSTSTSICIVPARTASAGDDGNYLSTSHLYRNEVTNKRLCLDDEKDELLRIL